MKNPNQLDENKQSVRQIKDTPKDLIYGQINGKKPVETRKTEMSNPVVTGGSVEQRKTTILKEEDLKSLFHKMMGKTKQEVPTKTFQRPNAIPNTNKPLALRQDSKEYFAMLLWPTWPFCQKMFQQPKQATRHKSQEQWETAMGTTK